MLCLNYFYGLITLSHTNNRISCKKCYLELFSKYILDLCKAVFSNE